MRAMRYGALQSEIISVSETADMLAHYFCISVLKVYALDLHITAS
jgi:hypothetical protein